MFRKRFRSLSDIPGTKLSFEAKDITNVQCAVGSCCVEIDAGHSGKIIQVNMKTPEDALDFNEHLRRSQLNYNVYVKYQERTILSALADTF